MPETNHATVLISPSRTELLAHLLTAGVPQLRPWEFSGQTLEASTLGSLTEKTLSEQNPLLVKRDNTVLFIQGCIHSLWLKLTIGGGYFVWKLVQYTIRGAVNEGNVLAVFSPSMNKLFCQIKSC